MMDDTVKETMTLEAAEVLADERRGWHSDVSWPVLCGAELDCGGSCVLPAGHLVPCECAGDMPGRPDTCPA